MSSARYPEGVHLPGLEHLLLDLAALVALTALLAAIALTVAITTITRHVRRHRHRRGALTVGLAAATTLASPGWWTMQRARRRMWRTTSAARHAVRVARRAGAPVGELPTLARQLNDAARSVDALARTAARTPGGRASASAEVRRVENAAQHLHRAAVDSLATVAGADVDPLLSAVRLETEALAAGVRTATALGSPGA